MNRTRSALLAAILGGSLLAIPLAFSALAAAPAQAQPPLGQNSLITYVASVEGVTPAVLRQDLKEGKTLLQIAGSKYGSANDLATALLRPVKARLDRAVSNGRLTASQESTIYARLHARVATLVVTPMPKLRALFGGSRAPGRIYRAHSALLQTMASACKTSPAALVKALEAGGKTPLAICQSTNPAITQQSLVSVIMSSFQTKLAAMAGRMGLTPQQQNQILSHIQMHVTRWVTTPIPTHGVHPF
jgi:hypothetical protein